MKKALSAFLALLMIVSCITIPVIAEGTVTTAENIIMLSACDSSDGWPHLLGGRGGAVDTENFTQGTASISETRKGGTIGAGYFEFVWSKGDHIDLTGMNRLVFDMYLSDTAIAGLNCSVELRSSEVCTSCRPNGDKGFCDHNEMSFTPSKLEQLFVNAPVVGWNRVEIPLSDFTQSGTATVNREEISYFRIYLPNANNVQLGSADTDYSVKLDNLHLTNRTAILPTVEGIDILVTDSETTAGWADYRDEGLPAMKNVSMDGHGKVVAVEYTGKIHSNGGWNKPADATGIKLSILSNPVDATAMKYYVFDLYVSDAEAISATEFHLELTSGGKQDKEEVSTRKTLSALKGEDLVSGWNRIYIALDSLTGSTGGNIDWSRWNYMRLYNAGAIDLGSKVVTLAFDNVGFAKEKWTPPAPETPDKPVKPEPPTLISLITGETLDGFATGDKLTLDTTDPWQGKASIARTFDGVVNTVAAIKFEYTMPNGKTYDATAVQTLCFDVYVSNAAAFEDAKFELELRGDGDDDNTETVLITTLSEMKGEALVDGWNHISVPLSNMSNKGTKLEQLCYYRLFMNGGTAGVEGETSVIKLDNVYVTADPVVYEDKIPMQIVKSSLATSGKVSPSNGHGDYMMQCVQYRTTPMDITGMSWIEFDIKIDNDIVNDIVFRLDITNSGESDKGQYSNTLPLSTWAGERLSVGEWHHVKIPIFALQNISVNGVTPNMTQWNYFRFFNNKTTTITGDAFTAQYGVEFKNFSMTRELTGGEELVWDAESYSQYEGGTTTDVTLSKGVGLDDVDGDGDKEYVIRSFAADSETKSIPGGNEQIVLIFNRHLRNVGFDNMSAFRFDIYVDNEKYLDSSFSCELTSSRGCDQSEVSFSGTLRDKIIENKGNGWYTIELKLSNVTGRTPGTQGAFMPSRFNFMRIFASSAINWDANESMTVAVDNFYVVREAAATEEEVFEIPAGAVVLPFAPKTFVDLPNGGAHATTGAIGVTEVIAPVDISGNNLLYAKLTLKGYDQFYNSKFCIELTSAGKCDYEEFSTTQDISTIFTRVDGQALQNGTQWVYTDLNNPIWKNTSSGDRGTVDFTRINYMRIFNQTGVFANTAASATLSEVFVANDNLLDTAAANSVDFTGVTLNLNESLTMTFSANIHPSLSNVTMMVNFDGTETKVEGVRVGTTNKVNFVFTDIMPYQMGDSISASLMAMTADGKILTDEITDYSVKQYCLNLMAALENDSLYDGSGKLVALLAEVLYYGAAVQNYTDYKVDQLVTDGVDLSARNALYAPITAPGLVGEQGDCPVAFAETSAVLGNTYALRVNLTAEDMTDVKLLVANGADVATITEFKQDETTGNYYVDVPVSAFAINDTYTFTFEGYDNYSLCYSFSSYIATRMAQLADSIESDTAVANEYALLDAILAYSAASNAYASR